MAIVQTVTVGGADTTVHLEDLYQMINILGGRDVRMLLPLFEQDPADAPGAGDIQDIGPRGHHFVKHTTADNDPYVQGDLLAYPFNGVDEAIDMADNDDFSFGADGTAPNEPSFSLVIAVKFNDVTDNTLISRYDITAGTQEVEYRLFMDSADLLTFWVIDDVFTVRVGRRWSAALVEDQWYIIIATYEGTGHPSGVRIFVDGVRVDNTNTSAGAYVAMHNETVATAIGYHESGAGILTWFLDGDIALPAITARQLTDGDVVSGAAAHPDSDVARLTRLYQEVLGI